MKIFRRVTGEKNWENAKLDRKIVNKRSRREIIDHRHTVNKQLLSVPSCKGLIKRRPTWNAVTSSCFPFLTLHPIPKRPIDHCKLLHFPRLFCSLAHRKQQVGQAENQSPKDTSCMDGPERGKDYAKNNTTGMSGGTAGRLDSGETKHRLTA
ncbi:hypothetical protein T05_12564 [Trichinella murrelli]|uniref:Uncharacterized protein n=1 Tax=Trichinella murrelli TaxID=144512 RepID=A0A0V0U569_9BILA|nr:hypothetical protein T05_12564 [Trichinella murrelli]